MEYVDSVVIGAGQAGPSLAVALAGRGQRVALIEGDLLGGTCVNDGCTPTKTLRKSARVAHLARRAADFGVATGEVAVDFAAAMDRMRDAVRESREGLARWLASTDGLEVIEGWASFEGPDTHGFVVGVAGRRLCAPRVHLNTGARATVPPIDGVDEVTILDNSGLLALTECPRHLLIIGGSYIGLEFGQMFRRLGASVTILDRSERLASKEDDDVSECVTRLMRDEGIELVLGADIRELGEAADGPWVRLADGREFSGSHVLMATGREPDTGRLRLDRVGVETDARGYIVTDGRLNTNVPGITALGDVNGRGAFTHTSYHDHEILLAAIDEAADLHQWADAGRRPTTYALYIDPPLARVGLSMRQARGLAEEGRAVLSASLPMSGFSRAKEEGETEGLVRVIVDGSSEAILGATVFGFGGDEVIAVLSNFMATGASYRIMRQALPVHPTVAEMLPTLLGKLEPLAPEDRAD